MGLGVMMGGTFLTGCGCVIGDVVAAVTGEIVTGEGGAVIAMGEVVTGEIVTGGGPGKMVEFPSAEEA